jgi:hypothetical protein
MTIQPPTHRHPNGDAGHAPTGWTLGVPPARAGGQGPALSPPRASVARAHALSRGPARELYRVCGEREFLSTDASGQVCSGEAVARSARLGEFVGGESFRLRSDRGTRRALRAGCVALLGGVIGGLAAVVLASASRNMAAAHHRGAARIPRATMLHRASSALLRFVRVRSDRLPRRVDLPAVARPPALRRRRVRQAREVLSASRTSERARIQPLPRRSAAPEPASRDTARSFRPLASAFSRPLPSREPAARRQRAEGVGSAPPQPSGPAEFSFER